MLSPVILANGSSDYFSSGGGLREKTFGAAAGGVRKGGHSGAEVGSSYKADTIVACVQQRVRRVSHLRRQSHCYGAGGGGATLPSPAAASSANRTPPPPRRAPTLPAPASARPQSTYRRTSDHPASLQRVRVQSREGHSASTIVTAAAAAAGARMQTDEQHNAWGPTSPPRGQQNDAWNSSGPGASSSSSLPPAHFPTTSTGSGFQASPSLVPRAPQNYEPRRTSTAAGEYGPPEPGPSTHAAAPPGGGGGGGAGAAHPREGFLRIRILGVERQRRDIYIKFNAEVSAEVRIRRRGLAAEPRRADSSQTNLPNFQHSTCALPFLLRALLRILC